MNRCNAILCIRQARYDKNANNGKGLNTDEVNTGYRIQRTCRHKNTPECPYTRRSVSR